MGQGRESCRPASLGAPGLERKRIALGVGAAAEPGARRGLADPADLDAALAQRRRSGSEVGDFREGFGGALDRIRAFARVKGERTVAPLEGHPIDVREVDFARRMRHRQAGQVRDGEDDFAAAVRRSGELGTCRRERSPSIRANFE